MNLGKYIVFLATALFISTSVLAGDEICNGGDVIVCSNQPIQLLDLVERSALYGWSTHPMEGFLSFTRSYQLEEHLTVLLSSVQTLSPKMHKCLNSYLENERFWSETRFVKAVEFGDVKDESAYVIPKGCRKEQAAIQVKSIKSYSGFRYLINQDIWKKMNDFQRAALVLHEIILRNYNLNPQWNGDTMSVRYLTGLIASEEVSTMTPKQFNAVLKDISFTCTENK